MASNVVQSQHHRHTAYSTTSDDEEELVDQDRHESDNSSSDDASARDDCLACPPFVVSRRRQRPATWWLSPSSFSDPQAKWVQEWNRVFLVVCAAGLFVDPLFFYALSINEGYMCLFVDGWFAITVTVLRCMTDALHVWNMWLQIKMGSRKLKVGGDGGEEEDDDDEMSGGGSRGHQSRVTKKGLLFDIFVVLPLPQHQQAEIDREKS